MFGFSAERILLKIFEPLKLLLTKVYNLFADNFDGFDTKVLELKTVTHMSGIFGRKRRMSMFVITGNGNGLGGFALAKANTMPATMRKAKNRAGQKLIYIERYNDHTGWVCSVCLNQLSFIFFLLFPISLIYRIIIRLVIFLSQG